MYNFPLKWLHMKATGSSFGWVLLRWACLPHLGLVNDEASIKLSKNKHMSEVFIGNRSFGPLSHPKTPGKCGKWFKKFGGHAGLYNRYMHISELAPIVTLVRPRAGYHCCGSYQIKKILGYSVGGVNASKQDAYLACRRVKRMGFFGVSELWTASMCLFHRHYGGAFTVYDLENVKTELSLYPQNWSVRGENLLKCDDEHEDRFFLCVLSEFLNRVRQAGCLGFLNHRDLGSESATSMLYNAIPKQSGVFKKSPRHG